MNQDLEWTDVAVIGGGPAGLFATKQLMESTSPISIRMLESGPKTQGRHCPADGLRCKDCATCTVLSGMGGGGLHSDGKLILDLDAGGYINEYAHLTSAEKQMILTSIRSSLESGTGAELGPRLSPLDQEEVVARFQEAGFALSLYDVLHIGTRNLQEVTERLIRDLSKAGSSGPNRLYVETRAEVLAILPRTDGFELKLKRGSRFAKSIILAVGKSGAPKLRPQMEALKVRSIQRPVWLGVRVQVSADAARELLAISFDPKISRTETNGRRVKTHCFCRDGSLLVMKYRDSYLVGGHSTDTGLSVQRTPTGTVNFNVLASCYMSQATVDKALQMFRHATGPAVAVQDMGSFLDPEAPLHIAGSGPTEHQGAEPVDIRSILDSFDGLGGSLASFLRDLGELFPGIIHSDNRLFGPALEWDFGSLNVDEHMETSVPGLYAVGDGAGLSQGVVHAAATGIVAARRISSRVNEEQKRHDPTSIKPPDVSFLEDAEPSLSGEATV